jgi:hypothetical protein
MSPLVYGMCGIVSEYWTWIQVVVQKRLCISQRYWNKLAESLQITQIISTYSLTPVNGSLFSFGPKNSNVPFSVSTPNTGCAAYSRKPATDDQCVSKTFPLCSRLEEVFTCDMFIAEESIGTIRGLRDIGTEFGGVEVGYSG